MHTNKYAIVRTMRRYVTQWVGAVISSEQMSSSSKNNTSFELSALQRMHFRVDFPRRVCFCYWHDVFFLLLLTQQRTSKRWFARSLAHSRTKHTLSLTLCKQCSPVLLLLLFSFFFMTGWLFTCFFRLQHQHTAWVTNSHCFWVSCCYSECFGESQESVLVLGVTVSKSVSSWQSNESHIIFSRETSAFEILRKRSQVGIGENRNLIRP